MDIDYCFGSEITLYRKDLFCARTRKRETSEVIQRMKNKLKGELYRFVDKHAIDLIIPENTLSIFKLCR